MAVTSAIAVAAVLGAGSTYMAYEGQEKQAKQQQKEAERQALITQERAEREERLERERIEYESSLAAEQAAYETGVSLEKAEFTGARIREEANLVLAAQKAGYAASGLGMEGSPLTVLTKTAREATIEREQVIRGHQIFAETRQKEAEEVKKGGATAFEWFKTRLHAETGYEVGSRYAEAKMFRTQAKYSKRGKYWGSLASLGGSGTKAYEAYDVRHD